MVFVHQSVDFTYYWFLATSISHRPSTVSKLCQLVAFISQLVSISNRPLAVTKPLSRLTLTLSLIFAACVVQSLSQVFIICINTMLLCITFVGNWLLIYSILVTSIPVQVLKWQPSQAIWTITLSYNAELIFYSNFTIIFAGCIITLHIFKYFLRKCYHSHHRIHILRKYIAMHGLGQPEEVPRIHVRHDSMHQNPGRSPETTRAPGHEAKAVVLRHQILEEVLNQHGHQVTELSLSCYLHVSYKWLTIFCS